MLTIREAVVIISLHFPSKTQGNGQEGRPIEKYIVPLKLQAATFVVDYLINSFFSIALTERDSYRCGAKKEQPYNDS